MDEEHCRWWPYVGQSLTHPDPPSPHTPTPYLHYLQSNPVHLLQPPMFHVKHRSLSYGYGCFGEGGGGGGG